MARSASSARSAQSARSVRSAMSVIHPADKVCTGQRDGQDLPHRHDLHSPAMSAGSTLPARSARSAKVSKIGIVCLVGKVSAAGTAGKIYLADKVRTVSDVGKVHPVGIKIGSVQGFRPRPIRFSLEQTPRNPLFTPLLRRRFSAPLLYYYASFSSTGFAPLPFFAPPPDGHGICK